VAPGFAPLHPWGRGSRGRRCRASSVDRLADHLDSTSPCPHLRHGTTTAYTLRAYRCEHSGARMSDYRAARRPHFVQCFGGGLQSTSATPAADLNCVCVLKQYPTG
jgi:hypothetical protein